MLQRLIRFRHCSIYTATAQASDIFIYYLKCTNYYNVLLNNGRDVSARMFDTSMLLRLSLALRHNE
jgi:hypothetical protein